MILRPDADPVETYSANQQNNPDNAVNIEIAEIPISEQENQQLNTQS